MFTVRIQSKSNDTFTDVKVIRLTEFNEAVADKANELAKANGLYCQLYIEHSDTVPNGYMSKQLEYSTVIWKANVLSTADALSALDSAF